MLMVKLCASIDLSFHYHFHLGTLFGWINVNAKMNTELNISIGNHNRTSVNRALGQTNTSKAEKKFDLFFI